LGVLLAFMLLWNMLGALILLPALAQFLLIRKTVKLEATVGHQAIAGGTC
jgi:hypothetical protein